MSGWHSNLWPLNFQQALTCLALEFEEQIKLLHLQVSLPWMNANGYWQPA